MVKAELISIITPCYNAAKFLNFALESAIVQTYKNWELICINDGSTDSTLKIIRNYIKKDSRIRLINNVTNQGVSTARNLGLKSAKGVYICFLDADDTWLPNKLENQYRAMRKENSPISATCYSRIDEYGEELGQKVIIKGRIKYSQYLKKTSIGFSTLLINKSLVPIPFFKKLPLHEDMVFICELYNHEKYVLAVEQILVKYRVRKDSLSSDKIKAAKQVWKIYRLFLKFNLIKSIYFYIFYAFNAILRRIVKS
ncbi:MAG: glycosyltransferase family 2 protein [Clostridiales bacterium]